MSARLPTEGARIVVRLIAASLGDKVTKDALYGEVRPIVEEGGQALERAYLMPDGTLLRRSQIANIAADPEGSPTETAQAFVDEQVSTRGYGTSSEYVRELIRRDQDRLHLRNLLLVGGKTRELAPRSGHFVAKQEAIDALGIDVGRQDIAMPGDDVGFVVGIEAAFDPALLDEGLAAGGAAGAWA